MVSVSDILIRIRGQDETGNAFKSVEEKSNQMKNTLTTAVGMVVGMVGYDLFNSFMEAGRGAINASGQLDYFAGRLKMSEQQSADFRKQLDDMQADFKKVNMTAVGATAEDLASRYDLPINKLGDLTQMTAVMSSEFIRNGRTQEDAVLAVADAMDGQFKRLQEIGITQDTLKNNGWNGNLEDQASLIDALNKSMENMGYDKIAKDITNLDDAYTALTVSGGNLIASVLVPLTPLIISVSDALINAISYIQHNGWAQGALLIGGLSVGFALLAGAAEVAETTILGLVTSAMPGLLATLWEAAGAFMAISVAGAPLWLIVGALAAIALAVYEVGIYFGWWTDVSSMLAAITDGIRRLWEAFINSPQVQGAIKMVQSALTDLFAYLQPAISWLQIQWNNLFGDAGSNPDAVRMIWQAFQKVGEVAEQIFPYIVQAFQTIGYVITPLWDGLMNIAGVFSQLVDGSISWQDAFIQIITTIGMSLSNFHIRILQLGLKIGQSLVGGIVNNVKQIPGRIWNYLTQSATRLSAFANTANERAKQAGLNILRGVVNHVMQLPARVYSYLMRVPGRISSAAGAAVGAAANLASRVVSAVTSGITGVADAVYNEFIQIGSKINSAVSSAVSAAINFGDNIKSAVLGALGIASPGIIQRKIAIEFADIPGRIGESDNYVYSAARDYAGNILKGFNAPQIPLSSIGTVRDNAHYSPKGINAGNVTNVFVNEIPIDARNMTKREAQGVITLALESLKDPKSI